MKFFIKINEIASLAIDFESAFNPYTPDINAYYLNELLTRIESEYGYKPMIYTRSWFWNNNVDSSYDFSKYPLWIADYVDGDVELPKHWSNANKTWSWWKYSKEENVNGADGYVGLNWIKTLFIAVIVYLIK